jgi:hypothetical protein
MFSKVAANPPDVGTFDLPDRVFPAAGRYGVQRAILDAVSMRRKRCDLCRAPNGKCSSEHHPVSSIGRAMKQNSNEAKQERIAKNTRSGPHKTGGDEAQ